MSSADSGRYWPIGSLLGACGLCLRDVTIPAVPRGQWATYREGRWWHRSCWSKVRVARWELRVLRAFRWLYRRGVRALKQLAEGGHHRA